MPCEPPATWSMTHLSCTAKPSRTQLNAGSMKPRKTGCCHSNVRVLRASHTCLCYMAGVLGHVT